MTRDTVDVLEDLYQDLDEARYVKRTALGQLLVWHGAHTVNIYGIDGSEVDVFTFGHEHEHDAPELVTMAHELMDKRARELSDDVLSARMDTATEYARRIGAEAGEAAASWYFDGNTDEATYRRVLAGLEDGDPAVLDTMPTADLSGQWADTLTGPQLLKDACDKADLDAEDGDIFDALFSDVCDAYRDAFDKACASAIESTARRMLEP